MKRYLLSIGDHIKSTNHAADIQFDSVSYPANGILKNVRRGSSGPGNTPSHGIALYTPEPKGAADTPENPYNILKDRTGPLDTSLIQVETTEDGWAEVWSFKGRLGAGGMVGHLYTTVIEHGIQQTLEYPKVEYWNNQTQKDRDPEDAGLEMLDAISSRIFSKWQGTRAS